MNPIKKEKDKCITILNENNLYIDLEDDGDIIMSYTNWHNHYFNAYEKFIEDLENILKSKKCAVIISSRKRWLASYLEEPNHNYVANIKNLPKEFISEIKIMGGLIELNFWDIKLNRKIKIEKEEIK